MNAPPEASRKQSQALSSKQKKLSASIVTFQTDKSEDYETSLLFFYVKCSAEIII